MDMTSGLIGAMAFPACLMAFVGN